MFWMVRLTLTILVKPPTSWKSHCSMFNGPIDYTPISGVSRLAMSRLIGWEKSGDKRDLSSEWKGERGCATL